MNENSENNRLIVKYLRNELTAAEQEMFENKLVKDAELKAELREMAQLSVGLDILDRIGSDHIDSEQLALYAENSGNLDKETLAEITSHLKSCDDCVAELTLCQNSLQSMPKQQTAAVESIWKRLLNSLVIRPIAFKPVYVYAATLLFVLVGYFGGSHMFAPDTVGYFEVISIDTRGVGDENVYAITTDNKIIELKHVHPVRSDCVYDLEILNSNQQPVFLKPNNLPQKVFAVEVPVSYLTPGNYYFVVIEKDLSGNILEKTSHSFCIKFSK